MTHSINHNEELIENFRKYLSERPFSTIRTYVYYVSDFSKFLSEKKGKKLSNFDVIDVKDYIDYVRRYRKYDGDVVGERNEELSDYTVNTLKSAIIKFIEFMSKFDDKFDRWLNTIEKGRDEILRINKYPKSKTSTRSLSKEEVKKILNIFDDKPEIYSGLVVLFWFGMRSGEVTLKLLDAYKGNKIVFIDFEKQRLCIETEKRRDENRFRLLPFSDEIEEYLKRWCEYLEKMSRKWKYENLSRLLVTKMEYRRLKIIKELGFFVTPKHARYTVETEFMYSEIPQILIDYYLGHKIPGRLVEEKGKEYIVRIPGGYYSTVAEIYRDKEKTCEKLRELLIDEEKHYLLKIIS